MAFNRFVAIEVPHHYRAWVRRPALAATILLPWLISLGFTMPVYFDIGATFTWNPKNGLCFAKMTGAVYMNVWFAVCIYAPMMIIGMIYVGLFVRLKVRRGGMNHPVVAPAALSVNPSLGNRRMAASFRERQIQIAQMLMMSFGWYFICYIPSPILTLNFSTLYSRDAMLQVWIIKTLYLFGYAASPVSRVWTTL